MKNARFANAHNKFLLLFTFVLTVLFATSCGTDRSKAHEVIEKYLKDRGAIEVKSDLFYTTADTPGKAYSSATATFNFANAQGTNQQEFWGFILTQEGEGWKIEKPAAYTTDQQKAALYLAGKKR